MKMIIISLMRMLCLGLDDVEKFVVFKKPSSKKGLGFLFIEIVKMEDVSSILT
jgi:hypothetical protein